MRKYLHHIFLLACFISAKSYAQDLIVTNVGDSIACKIVHLEEKSIHYSYIKYNFSEIREISRSRVKSFIPGFYSQKDSLNNVSAGKWQDIILPASQAPDLISVTDSVTVLRYSLTERAVRWRLGIHGGLAYRLFKPRISATDYELQYINDLKSGYSFGADLFYFPWEKVGFGIKYDIYKSKAERDIRTKDDITIHFAGVSVAHKQTFENKQTSILTAFWVGYQPYRNFTRSIGQDYTLKASTMGWGGSVGIDQKIGKKLALNISGSCFIGSVYKFKKEYQGKAEIINLPRENFEDLSRAELTIGLKFLN